MAGAPGVGESPCRSARDGRASTRQRIHLNGITDADIQKRINRKAVDKAMARILQLTLNGRARTDAVADNVLLLDYLREIVGLTGTKTGCDGGECGACTVLVDDRPRLSCLTLAAAVAGRRVDTIESLAIEGRLSAVQRGFHEKLGSQCGYCTPGFIMASAGLLRRNPHPTEEEIRGALGSNICRCTGYVKIIEAVQHAAELCAAGVSP
jgi:4-hydroxybenzoyl-CoA reductase subunit gamma